MNLKHKLIAAALLGAFSSMAMAQTVGVSWSNFQEERWKTDEKAIKDQLAKLGGSYVQRRRRRLAREAARRHRRPDRQGRQGADHPGDGQGRDRARRWPRPRPRAFP